MVAISDKWETDNRSEMLSRVDFYAVSPTSRLYRQRRKFSLSLPSRLIVCTYIHMYLCSIVSYVYVFMIELSRSSSLTIGTF